MNWLRRFMCGRYGSDQLCFGLVIFGFVLALIFSFLPHWLSPLRLLTYLPLLLAIYRTLSRNISKRRRENEWFMSWWKGISGKFTKKVNRVKDSKTYRFIKCPGCRQTLRLPKGRGKIRITCPKCGNVFEKNT